MVCSSAMYSGGESVPAAPGWTNWSGHFSGPVNRNFEPDSLADLVNVVQRAASEGHQLHVLGSGWSYENLAHSTDWMVNVRRLNKPITTVTSTALNATWAAKQAAGGEVLFHIEAGATIAEVNAELRRLHLAMPTLGGSNGQTLGGALSTGTHGADIDIPPIASAVMAMHLVTVEGREIWLERNSDPITDAAALAQVLPCREARIVAVDDIFNAALVGLGRFGIIYSYVLRVQHEFRLAEWTVKIPQIVLTTALRTGATDGTFLQPLLFMLPPPPAALGATNVPMPHSLEVAFDSSNLGSCYVRRRWLTNDPTDLNISNPTDFLCQIGAAGVLGIAEAALEPAMLIPFYNIAVTEKKIELAVRLAANPSMTAGEMLALAAAAIWDLKLGWLLPRITGSLFDGRYGLSLGAGIRGPSDLILSGHPEQSQQNCFRADSIEPVFDAHQSQYLDFLNQVLFFAPTMRQSGYISLRWSATIDAPLSMHNYPSANAVAIEITSLSKLPDNAAYMALCEAIAFTYNGRPHWGQINTLDANRVDTLFGPLTSKWRGALGLVVGPSTTFSNAYTIRRNLEPNPGAVRADLGQLAADLIPVWRFAEPPVGGAVVPRGERPVRPRIRPV